LVALRADPFNCLGSFSDAGPGDCKPLEFINMTMERSFGAFRTPSLRGVSQRSVLGHAGQVKTLRQMVAHYNNAPASPLRNLTGGGRISEIVPLGLTQSEIDSLIAFLESI
jgi:cytochrome c peroxidase